MEQLPEQLGQKALALKEKQDAMFAPIAPTATKMFGKSALNRLVKSFNSIAPMYGLLEVYPDFTADVKTLPVDFVKLLSMVGSSTRQAAEADVLDASQIVSLEGIVKDNGLLALAAKLDILKRDLEFKRWLTEAPDMMEGEGAPEDEPVSQEEAPSVESGDELMNLLKGRMA